VQVIHDYYYETSVPNHSSHKKVQISFTQRLRLVSHCWVLGSLPMWRKGPKLEKPMSHLT